jgi:UDP-glucose 6-dehydrogenase
LLALSAHDNNLRFFSLPTRSVNTPTKKYGIGAGQAADLKNWELAARNISKVADCGKIVIEKSTLPVRTAHSMKRVLNSNERGFKFEILSNPEFLAEGTAMTDLQKPDRCLIGGIRVQVHAAAQRTHTHTRTCCLNSSPTCGRCGCGLLIVCRSCTRH